jgi:glycosyltransferase involved in cell wall biosynthesis
MKILIINTLYYPNQVGGAEKSVQLLAESLLDRGLEPVVISTTNQNDYVDNINGVKVYYLKNRNLYWSIDSKGKNVFQKVIWHGIDIYNPLFKDSINDIIDKEKPEIIHTNNLTGFSIVPWLIAKEKVIPVVHTLRDFSLICSKTTMFKNNHNCDKQCFECKIFCSKKKKVSNNSLISYVVGNSDFMLKKHKEMGYFENVPSKRIFNGAVTSKKGLENELINNSNTKKIKFFYMGRIDKTKGVNLLLDTFKDIKNAELLLAGNVNDDEIKKEMESGNYGGNIKFLGFVNPNDYLKDIDILIAPSLWHEPLPRVILEAYSYNKPVIGSNRGGIPESIMHNKTGFIFDPDKKGDLEYFVRKFLDQPELINEFKKNIPEYLKQFSLDITVSQYIEVYRNIIK